MREPVRYTSPWKKPAYFPVTETLPKGTSSDSSSLEYKLEVDELRRLAALFVEQGFSTDEVKSTLLDMANFRHLRNEILEIVSEL